MLKKEQISIYTTLILRWYLVYYMINYGWAKLTLNQFGVHDISILDQPLKDIDSFYVAWHLFGRSPFFNVVTGGLEIIGGVLLIFNRTVLPGALLVLSILVQILVIDIAFTTGVFGASLPLRISGMILCVLLILFHYKEDLKKAWKSITSDLKPEFSYKWWHFLILPVIGFLMDFVIALLYSPIKYFLD